MNKNEALHRIENCLYRPVGALLGVAILSSVGISADRTIDRSHLPKVTLEQAELSPATTSDTWHLELPDHASTGETPDPTTVPAPILAPPLTGETVPATSLQAAEAPQPELSDCPAEWEMVSQGICYTNQAGFHIARVDLGDPNISICPAYTAGPDHLGTLREAAERMNAVVAINASFFQDRRALGPLACDGKWVSDDPFSLPVLEYRTDGTSHNQTTEEALAADVTVMRFAVSGSHILVSDGQPVVDFGEDNVDYTLYGHHNRTAIGIDDNHYLFMVVTAAGNTVTMPELAQFMSSFLHVRFAENLDGGKSRAMEVQGESVVQGADAKEQMIATGLFAETNP